MDGRRPLLGEGVPRGDVGEVLREAPCDVAVLVAKEGAIGRCPGQAAASWCRSAAPSTTGPRSRWGRGSRRRPSAPLNLLGAAGQTEERARVTRLLGDAGLLVQQYAGVQAQPVMAEEGRESLIEAASSAGLLVIGLSDRWREEGLGPTRSEIAKAAPAPVLFVRRGTRPGALAPREDVTRFGWSSAGVGGFKPGEPLT